MPHERSWAGGLRSRRWPSQAASGVASRPASSILKKQHSWGDISDRAYQAERDAVRAALSDLPDDDRIRSFDAHRTRILELPNAIEVASPARREELARIVVQQVVVRDRQVQSITWTPAARPFFEKRQRACPQGVSSTLPLSDDDSLAWYVA